MDNTVCFIFYKYKKHANGAKQVRLFGPILTYKKLMRLGLGPRDAQTTNNKDMNYTQEQFKQATFITGAQYMDLVNPVFEGQTRVNADNKYKMYWSCNGNLYYTEGTL